MVRVFLFKLPLKKAQGLKNEEFWSFDFALHALIES
jgi:hypothetical protein